MKVPSILVPDEHKSTLLNGFNYTTEKMMDVYIKTAEEMNYSIYKTLDSTFKDFMVAFSDHDDHDPKVIKSLAKFVTKMPKVDLNMATGFVAVEALLSIAGAFLKDEKTPAPEAVIYFDLCHTAKEFLSTGKFEDDKKLTLEGFNSDEKKMMKKIVDLTRSPYEILVNYKTLRKGLSTKEDKQHLDRFVVKTLSTILVIVINSLERVGEKK
jgi:hypothetical protein